MNKKNSRVECQQVEAAVVGKFPQMETAGIAAFRKRRIFLIIFLRNQLLVPVCSVFRILVARILADKIGGRLALVLFVEFTKIPV